MIISQKVRVGSRKSPLAVAQTEEVLTQLRVLFPNVQFETVAVTTSGDRNKDAPLLSIGRGAFVKEIERALLDGEIDLAVHSAKDVPTALPEGLTLVAVERRQDPRDVQVNRWGLPLVDLPFGARMGTSSPRRVAQLKALRPDLKVLPIRGNVGTRLEKAQSTDYDGAVLAAAGLIRLGLKDNITEYFSPDSFTPDVGQGTLAAEIRADDRQTADILAAIDHPPTRIALQTERAFLERLGGGCEVPVAAYASVEDTTLHISAMAAIPDGRCIVRTSLTCSIDDPKSSGIRIAEALLKAGASDIIRPL